MKFRRAPGIPRPPVPSDSLVTPSGDVIVPSGVATLMDGYTSCYECPLCRIDPSHRGSEFGGRCGNRTVDYWSCTRPKGHDGPCVGCGSGCVPTNHNLDRYYWEDIITTLPGYAQLPEQTPQPLEI